ncbi:hypothetical protein EUTSA_v10028269mg, partial [Eutrema salsugineum]
MVRLSDLPDELLLTILSLLPIEVAVSTSVLSKRWKFLWMSLPKLEYSTRNHPDSAALGEFIYKHLSLHRAPAIESLRLDLSPHINPEDIKRWVRIAVSHNVRELNITYDSDNGNIFPGSFYTCNSLVVLELGYVTLMDVPSSVCLPSLKTMELECLVYANQESLQRLLSICPVLEELSVRLGGAGDINMRKFSIVVPSLRSLSLLMFDLWWLNAYVIDTPSLEYFKLGDRINMEHYSEFNMPKLREAYVDAPFLDLNGLITSITSVKRLTLCSVHEYGEGFVLKHLEHLKLCECKNDSLDNLGELLKGSPTLRVLDICVLKDHDNHGLDEYSGFWNQPSRVPECLLSSLQILNWSRYFGRPHDRKIAVYILRNACRLKTATFFADRGYYVSNLEMIKELTLSSRASSTCEL